jgi:tRNA U34 5-carboxymethylaminomethyl modifying GTPase MnmE/TrmE
LIDASASLRNAQHRLADSSHKELLASDLRLALHAYSEISGGSYDTAVMDRLFSAFCIGK